MKKFFFLMIIISNTYLLKASADNSRWMNSLDNKLRLSDIVIPGSHDAGMSHTEHCSFGVQSKWTRTQGLSIANQARAGSRYFDIRIDYDHGNLVTYHRTDSFGCDGEKLEDILNGVVSFLQQNPSEIIILKFSHTRDDGEKSRNDITRRVISLIKKYDHILYKSSKKEKIAQVSLSALRGKLITVFDEEYGWGINPAQGILSYADCSDNDSCSSKNASMAVYDKYSDTDNFDKMQGNQLEKLLDYSKPGSDYLFLLSWTLTGDPIRLDLDIKNLASDANSRLKEKLDQVFKEGYPKPNIVYIDFMDINMGSIIIKYNTSIPVKKSNRSKSTMKKSA